MIIDPNCNQQHILIQENYSLEESLLYIKAEEKDKSHKEFVSKISDEESYCGNYYNDQEGFRSKLKQLGKTITGKENPYCPIKLLSKQFCEENCMKVEDIPKGLFRQSPIDEYIINDDATKFIDKIGHRLDIVDDANNLNNSFNTYNKGRIKKKETVQRYKANQLRNELNIKKSIESDHFRPSPSHEFKLNERGHIRYIKAPSIIDQVVQKSTNNNLLIPNIRPKLIYDNGASLKYKGVSFTRERFKYHLQSAYREFGNEGYIILMDYSKFFDNICHIRLKKYLSSVFTQEEIDFVSIFIDEFNIDVSYLEDEDFILLQSIPFNSLDYNEYLSKNPNIKDSLDKSKILERSMGIGNHIAQISGVFYPTRVDNYCTKVKGIKYYGRYMDDTYIILKTKEEAKALLDELYIISSQEGLFINRKKTYISSLHKWICFLKINYFITITGKIIEKPVSETFKREFKRITAFHTLYTKNRMTLEHAIECYRSWRGSYIKFDCKYEVKKLDNYFIEIFKLPEKYKFKTFNK